MLSEQFGWSAIPVLMRALASCIIALTNSLNNQKCLVGPFLFDNKQKLKSDKNKKALENLSHNVVARCMWGEAQLETLAQ